MDRVKQFAINRQVVIDGLKRRAAQKEAAERESALDAFEIDMIRMCNFHREDVQLQNKMDADTRRTRRHSRAKIASRAKAKARKQRRRKDSALGCLTFFVYTLAMFRLTVWTYFPVWGAIPMVACGALFLLLYLCKVNASRSAERKA